MEKTLDYSTERRHPLRRYRRAILFVLLVGLLIAGGWLLEMPRRLGAWRKERACLYFEGRDQKLLGLVLSADGADSTFQLKWEWSPADEAWKQFRPRPQSGGLFGPSAPRPAVVFLHELSAGSDKRLVVVELSARWNPFVFTPTVVVPGGFWGSPQRVDQTRVVNEWLVNPDELKIEFETGLGDLAQPIEVFMGSVRAGTEDQFEIPIRRGSEASVVHGALGTDGHVRLTYERVTPSASSGGTK